MCTVWAKRETEWPTQTVMERYIEFFNGYRNAYGVADFNHQDSKVDPETGKKKPVYRWNFEELTKDIYQQAKTFSDNISKGSVKAKHGEEKKGSKSHF